MKKWIFGLAAFVLLAIAGLYFFMPRQFTVSKVTVISATSPAIYRFLAIKDKWHQWLPEATPSENGFTFNGDFYEVIPGFMSNTIAVNIHHKDSVINSTITVLALKPDTNAVQWKCVVRASANPIQRLLRYADAGDVKRNMNAIFEKLERFLSKKENVYGGHISIVSTKDTLLVSTKTVTNSYPSTAAVYESIGKLESFIAAKGDRVTGSPLLNISRLDSSQYQVMVALPVDRELKSEADIEFKRMIPGNFLMMEVKGGTYTAANAGKQLELYLSDHEKTVMAIPFEVLITNRITEPDTSKWLTKVYMPVYR
jgi:hypothetical protein